MEKQINLFNPSINQRPPTMVDHQVTFFFSSTVSSREGGGGLSSVQLVIWNEKKTRVNGTVKGLKAQSSFSSAPASQNKTRAGLRFKRAPLSTCFLFTLSSRRYPHCNYPSPLFRILLRWWIAWRVSDDFNSWFMAKWWMSQWNSVKFRITLNFNRGEILFVYTGWSLWNRGTKILRFARKKKKYVEG